MSILCLHFGKDRKVQAELNLKEALRMGLQDIEILEEIGDLYFKDADFLMALQAYQQITIIDEKYGEGW
jgi:hypothetical protein